MVSAITKQKSRAARGRCFSRFPDNRDRMSPARKPTLQPHDITPAGGSSFAGGASQVKRAGHPAAAATIAEQERAPRPLAGPCGCSPLTCLGRPSLQVQSAENETRQVAEAKGHLMAAGPARCDSVARLQCARDNVRRRRSPRASRQRAHQFPAPRGAAIRRRGPALQGWGRRLAAPPAGPAAWP